MDPIRKIPKKFTKKFGNKVINRQYFRCNEESLNLAMEDSRKPKTFGTYFKNTQQNNILTRSVLFCAQEGGNGMNSFLT